MCHTADALAFGILVECAIEQAKRRMQEEILMTSGLQMSVKRGAVDEATCAHYGYPVWVSAFGQKNREKYRARCLNCGSVGPVVREGPMVARRALRAGRAHAA